MLTLLRTTYLKLEELKGPRLYKLLLIVIAIFLPIGLALGYVTTNFLTNNEVIAPVQLNNMIPTDEKYYEGRIVYVDPNFYSQDKITYVLQSMDGKELILLKANDQKLQVAEGNVARLYGSVSKTVDGRKDVLIVDKVLINNK